jgi:hypothetical protein
VATRGDAAAEETMDLWGSTGAMGIGKHEMTRWNRWSRRHAAEEERGMNGRRAPIDEGKGLVVVWRGVV